MTAFEELVREHDAYVINTYGKRDIALVRGQGTRVWDINGKEYLDFLAGISVNNLGHCHPAIVAAIKEQCEKLIHCSNLYYIESQIQLAKILCDHCFAQRVFFANSGAEAVEAAIKLARLAAHKKGNHVPTILSTLESFHGRTLVALTATGQEKYRKGFEPLMPGFSYVEFNNIEALKREVDDHLCAIIVEPVQGEGGINIATREFLQACRDICDERDAVLIFDEIQCGLGRTGKDFAYMHFDVEPDVMTLAKAVGGGLPLGVLLVSEKYADVFTPGTHASTFGGNPVAAAAGYAFARELFEKNLSAQAAATGEHLNAQLEHLSGKYSFIKEVRGLGLMQCMEMEIECADLVRRCAGKGLLVNCTMGKVFRMLPPLNVAKEDCDNAINIIDEVLSEVQT